jgi:hypothetical protein
MFDVLNSNLKDANIIWHDLDIYQYTNKTFFLFDNLKQISI